MPEPRAAEYDAVATCAAGEAALHAVAHAGLDLPWRVEAGLAWASRPAHRFLLGAVTLEPRPLLPAGLRGTVRDSFAALDPALLPGWSAAPADPWMYRPPGPVQATEIAGVTVERTHDALAFEHAAFVSAAGSPPDQAGELHPAGSADVAGLHLFMALRGSDPIGSALAVVHDTGVQVSAVAVMAHERGRGLGSALTVAALRCAPELPATLAAGAVAESTYRRLGFSRVGARPLDWTHDRRQVRLAPDPSG